jgi:hypothetical protein
MLPTCCKPNRGTNVKHNPLSIRLNRLSNSIAGKLIFLVASIVALLCLVLMDLGQSGKALGLVLVLCDFIVVCETWLDLQRICRSA